MKKMRLLFGIIIMAGLLFTTNSCTEDIPTYTKVIQVGCFDVNQTHFKVVVCDITQTNYFGGAEVFVYYTEADRTNDPQRTQYAYKGTTDNGDPAGIGAMFYKMEARKYYIFARRDMGAGNFLTGVIDGTNEWCNTSTFVAVVQ
jgi:hypothetical protein